MMTWEEGESSPGAQARLAARGTQATPAWSSQPPDSGRDGAALGAAAWASHSNPWPGADRRLAVARLGAAVAAQRAKVGACT